MGRLDHHIGRGPRTAAGDSVRPMVFGGEGTSSDDGSGRARTPYVEELVRRLSLDFRVLDVHTRPSGATTLTVQYQGLDHPVVMSLHEDDLEVATSARHAGRGGPKA